MTTKTVTLDFGVPAVAATVTFEEEPPRGPDACPMCSEAVSYTHLTLPTIYSV